MNVWIRNIFLMTLMFAASGMAVALRPTQKLADTSQKIDLEQIIPRTFGEWELEPQGAIQVIDPQQQASIDRIYTQTLSRTYVNQRGNRVMLSLAYGTDQSDDVALHYPEVCYPAQGFALLSSTPGVLETRSGALRVKYVMTQFGNRREPIIYWTTLGDRIVRGGLEAKLAQLEYGFHGQIPDGLLFRVSSIHRDAEAGYAIQKEFVNDLLDGMSSADRLRLTGRPVATTE